MLNDSHELTLDSCELTLEQGINVWARGRNGTFFPRVIRAEWLWSTRTLELSVQSSKRGRRPPIVISLTVEDGDRLAEMLMQGSGSSGSPDQQLDALVKLAEETFENEGELDGLVHDLASNEASEVNNRGFRAQIEYMIKHLGVEGAEKELRSLVSASQKESGDVI